MIGEGQGQRHTPNESEDSLACIEIVPRNVGLQHLQELVDGRENARDPQRKNSLRDFLEWFNLFCI